MLLGKRTRRMVAATLLTILLTETFAPAVTYALTSGPTQPEATSFEPIDTTDLVNPQTGDFTYNLPLLEVPGPEGGYPLSLSYHAGIQTNEDASWVGLGWTLNPGAINRSVNGLPDDWRGQQNNTHTYWAGGKTSTYGVGVSIGQMNSPINVSFGLSVSQDTYRGFGVGFDASVGPLSFSKGPFDKQPALSLSILQENLGLPLVNSSVGLNISTNFSSVTAGVNGSLGIMGQTLHGSLQSNGKSSTSVSGGGAPFFMHSSTATKVQTSTWGFNQTIPVGGLNISLSFSKTRYWTNETATTYAAGSLNQRSGFGTDVVYDNYSLLDDPSIYNVVVYPDPTVLQGGALPDFDEYNVSGQGLGGNMRPYFYQGQLMGQEQLNTNNAPVNQFFVNNLSGEPGGFRFENDFSNSFRQAYTGYSAATLAQNIATTTTVPPFDPGPLFGNTIGKTDYGNGTSTNNYGASINSAGIGYMSLAGSRHVDMGVKIMPSNCQGYNPGDRLETGMINGFSITNESGVTYHYGLPAYSYGEENYQEKVDHINGLYFNRATKGHPYAYMWYLTSITGTDYVDRNNNHIADAGDWGYWVNFEYGKWSNEYVWRNPSEGFQRDEDNNFQDASMGYREVYYLNAIRTRSHIALFEKDVRNDAKGSSPQVFCKNVQNGSPIDYAYPLGVYDANSSQSMQLSKIYLMNIADANAVAVNAGEVPSYTPPGRFQVSCTSGQVYNPCTDCELGDYVLDSRDVNQAGRAALEAKALRVIDFSYDYSLCPNTTNSYNSISGTTIGPLTGKLTLKTVTLRGKGGVTTLPSLQFGYELPASAIKTATGLLNGTTFTTSTPVFQVGDMLRTTGGYLGVVTSFNPSTNVYTLANSSVAAPNSPVTVTLSTTKNPPYYKDAYDMWGSYKSDYDPTVLKADENLGRYTSAVSAPGTDAWSLRTITTQLGDQLQLNYESDTYHQVAMDNTASLSMMNISVVAGSNNGTIQFQLANTSPSTNPGAVIHNGSVFSQVLLLIDGAYSGCTGCRVKTTPPITSLTITGLVTNAQTGVVTYTGVLGSPITYPGFNGTIWTGNLWVDQQNTDFYGGGIRVASLAIGHTFDNSVSTISYGYNTPGTGFSSGVTSFLPTVLDAYDGTAVNTFPTNPTYETQGVWADIYQRTLYKNVNTLFPLVRELPPPGVMYQYVTETDQYTPSDEPAQRTVMGSMQYQFEVFSSNMVGREVVDPTTPILQSGRQFARNWVLRKFTSCLGNVKTVTQYDAQGNLLKQTINHYLHDGLEALDFHDFLTQYQTRLTTYNNQGFIEERYSEIKNVDETDPSNTSALNQFGGQDISGIRATMLAREDYPCIQTGQTVIDYAKGVQTSSTNLAFDFYSGAVTETVETDVYGNNFMTQSVPAYQASYLVSSALQQIYPAMGLKINNDNNLNMLTQTAESYTYKVDGSNHPIGLVSASATTWSNGFSAMDVDGSLHIQDGRTETVGSNTLLNGNIWRPQATYSWMPSTQTSDGLTPTASFSDFNWLAPASSDARWAKTENVTLYDTYSKALEDQDINNNYQATHMDYGENKVILTGSPANYYEIAFSGAEDAAVTQASTSYIQAANGTVATGAGVAHTGAQSLLLGVSGQKSFLYSVPVVSSGTGGVIAGRSYTAAVWVKPVSGTASNVNLYYSVNGTIKNTPLPSAASSASSTKISGGWTLITLTINGSDLTAGSTLNVWCENDHATATAYVDDMRLQPVNASTTAYVYDPFSGELTDVLDNSNLYTRYQYDAAGRLVDIYKEKLNSAQFTGGEFKTNQYRYNYSATQFPNDPINGVTYTKNNCPLNVGLVPTSSVVTIPSGTYTSFVSVPDADAIAAVYAQDYANTHGSCKCSPTFTWGPGISGASYVISPPSGNAVSFELMFNLPTSTVAGETFNLGNIIGSCDYPTANRTFPCSIAGNGSNALFQITVTTQGNVQLTLLSGTLPSSGFVTINSEYGISSNLGYSDAMSGQFAPQCSPGVLGNTVTFSIPQGMFVAADLGTADNLANTYFQSQGQASANATCGAVIACPFTWSTQNISDPGNAMVTLQNGVFKFNLPFVPNGSDFTGGTIGTIGSPCIPGSSQSFGVNITSPSTAAGNWVITFSNTGVVSVASSFGIFDSESQLPPLVFSGTINNY